MAYLLKMSVENSSRIYLRTTDDEVIAEELRPYHVLFFHEEDILVADKTSSSCCTLAERIKQRIPELNTYFVESSAMQVNANDPAALSLAAQSRAQYYQEHTHDENEAWFFQHGQAAFYLRLQEYVYAIICTAGDFICVPGKTRHWFDAGAIPAFSGLRFYLTMNAPVISGDDIALRYPQIEHVYSLITLETAL